MTTSTDSLSRSRLLGLEGVVETASRLLDCRDKLFKTVKIETPKLI